MNRLAPCTLLCVALGLTACTDVNSRTTIGASHRVPALSPAEPLAGDDAPLTRLDRSDWAPIEYRLPVDGTVHAPVWRSHASFSDEQRRQHGLFPTPESSLDLGGPAGEQVAHGSLEPLRAVGDLIAMPVRMVLEPAWTHRQSPRMYKRWGDGQWLAGPLPPVRKAPVVESGAQPMQTGGS